MSATISPRQLRAALILLAGLGMAALGDSPAARADDLSAKTNGHWRPSSTWTPSGVPGLNDNVYIGTTYPSGAVSTTTVNLTHNQQARVVNLGYGTGSSGTLNLGNFNLTADTLSLGADLIGIGVTGGTGAIA